MRLREITPAHQRTLRELSARISKGLEAEFSELPVEGPNVGVRLQERGKKATMEIPALLLQQAEDDATARESIRVRIKATRDRMLFRPPPTPLPKKIASAPDPSSTRFGMGFGGGGGGNRRGGRR
jgi:hypothetical protein